MVILDNLQEQCGVTLIWAFPFDKSLCPSEFVVRVCNLSTDLVCVLKGIDWVIELHIYFVIERSIHGFIT